MLLHFEAIRQQIILYLVIAEQACFILDGCNNTLKNQKIAQRISNNWLLMQDIQIIVWLK
jgi:hypothetical protein